MLEESVASWAQLRAVRDSTTASSLCMAIALRAPSPPSKVGRKAQSELRRLATPAADHNALATA